MSILFNYLCRNSSVKYVLRTIFASLISYDEKVASKKIMEKKGLKGYQVIQKLLYDH